jgi:uncharacterized protein (TIGR02594 family)
MATAPAQEAGARAGGHFRRALAAQLDATIAIATDIADEEGVDLTGLSGGHAFFGSSGLSPGSSFSPAVVPSATPPASGDSQSFANPDLVPDAMHRRIDIGGGGFATDRYNNPGAQWPTERAVRYGMSGYGVIGGGNKIAAFPTPVHGAAANMDLLAHRYAGKTIGQAAREWSGGGRGAVPGYSSDQRITPELARDPNFMIPFMRSHVAGEGTRRPLTDQQWADAFRLYRSGGRGWDERLPALAAAAANVSAPAGAPGAAVDSALGELGLHERRDRAAVRQYLATGGSGLDPATTAWCAAFVNSSLQQHGIEGSHSNVANSFQRWGAPVHDGAQRGDVVVIPRGRGPNETGGHVGLATGNVRTDARGNRMVEMISGNRRDRVELSWEPESRVMLRRARDTAPAPSAVAAQ